jgi:hypothetical protein
VKRCSPSYAWVKKNLQSAGVVEKHKRRGAPQAAASVAHPWADDSAARLDARVRTPIGEGAAILQQVIVFHHAPRPPDSSYLAHYLLVFFAPQSRSNQQDSQQLCDGRNRASRSTH